METTHMAYQKPRAGAAAGSCSPEADRFMLAVDKASIRMTFMIGDHKCRLNDAAPVLYFHDLLPEGFPALPFLKIRYCAPQDGNAINEKTIELNILESGCGVGFMLALFGGRCDRRMSAGMVSPPPVSAFVSAMANHTSLWTPSRAET